MKHLSHLILVIGLLLTPTTQAAMTTAQVIASSACPACLDYQTVGVCVWMTCTIAGCDTQTSVKVRHRLPDLVVMSYPGTGMAPWVDTAWMSQSNGLSGNGGHSTKRTVQGLDSPSMRFYNVDVIGHPGASTIYTLLSGMGFSVRSEALPLMPHYLSTLDPLGWRYNLPDNLTLTGLNPFGESLGNFGSVYPRGGFVTQKHPFKAAALTAFRALHVVTRIGQSRVYQPFVPLARAGYWPPKPVTASIANVGGVNIGGYDTAFQMIYPIPQIDAHVWPQFDDTLFPFDPYVLQTSITEQYVWAVWRMYRGCQRKGTTLIAHYGV